MFGLGMFWVRERQQRMDDAAVVCCPPVPWDWKWHREVRYTAESFQAAAAPVFPDTVRSPCGRWEYRNQTLRAGRSLLYLSGRRRGRVGFDGDVTVPALFRVPAQGNPWMSLTPSEYITLRPGNRLAKGHVVVAGLGLGWQLARVLERTQVKRVTLVEQDPGLVDWILPQVANPRNVEIDVRIGDARKIVPSMEADVALIDIFPDYGFNDFPPCFGIRKVWCWGSAKLS